VGAVTLILTLTMMEAMIEELLGTLRRIQRRSLRVLPLRHMSPSQSLGQRSRRFLGRRCHTR
jgi:hypothetical protein